jgi:hypothetical protein
MEPNKTQHNTQTALFAIAIVVALGVGFYMGYQTGFVNGGADMHSMMHSETETAPHVHGEAGAGTTAGAMQMMDGMEGMSH